MIQTIEESSLIEDIYSYRITIDCVENKRPAKSYRLQSENQHSSKINNYFILSVLFASHINIDS